ncbi:MAG TPA: LemA family protein [Ideonella sp.]|jgi:LemA protein|nr:LemA family protein [Ideonella sp.]
MTPDWLDAPTWPDWGRALVIAAGLAVMVFWLVGAYNRLTRLRGAIGTAWQQIDELLSRRSLLLSSLVEAVREPLVDEAGTLATLSQAEQRQRAAALAVRGRAAQAVTLTAWVVAEGELASPLARLLALLEQRPELAGSEAVVPAFRELAVLSPRLAYARQMFSSAAASYNDALEEIPTRWVARVFSMRPTPTL